METKERLSHRLLRGTVQSLVRREVLGWPPYTPSGIYQPHRPETKPETPKVTQKK